MSWLDRFRGEMHTEQPKTLSEMADENPVGLVKELVRVTNEKMSQKYEMWRRHRKKLRNEWYLGEGNKRPLYSTNYLRSKLNTVKAFMALETPQPFVRGVESSDDAGLEYKQYLLDWVMGDAQAAWERRARELTHETEVCGMAWLKVVFDQHMNKGEGGVRFYVLPPECVKVDPKAANYENARWVIHERRDVSLEEILATTGKMPTGGSAEREKDDFRPDEQRGASSSQTYTIWECYLRDYSTELVIDIDPETGEEVQSQKRKFPTWRLIEVCDGLKEPIRDEPYPYEHGRLPLIPSFTEDDPTTLYPMSIMELIEPLQDLSDALDEQIYRNMRLVVNRQRKLQTGAGLTRDQIDNHPGRVYEMTNVNALQWDNPPSLSSDIYIYRASIEERIDKVSGIFEVTQGRTERGVTAYAAIATLQDASTRNIRMRIEILAEVAVNAAKQAISLIKQYRGPQFLMRLVGGDNAVILDEYPDMLVTAQGEQIPAMLATTEMKREWREMNGISVVLADIDEDYDITVSADNALPSSRMQKARIALELFNLQETDRNVIDAEGLLDALDWPGRSSIFRRKAAKKQEMMEQMMSQMGQMAGEQQQPIDQSGKINTIPPVLPVEGQETL